jgi:hypothetical protein
MSAACSQMVQKKKKKKKRPASFLPLFCKLEIIPIKMKKATTNF